MDAAVSLAKDGIEAEVIDLRTVMPLDFETVAESVRKTGRLVAVTEAPCFGSIASEVAARIQESVFDWLAAPVVRVGAKHAPIAHSPALFEAVIPQAADIDRAARALVSRTDA
jgi:pyruvate dehydrogenase E1 component beta subunit